MSFASAAGAVTTLVGGGSTLPAIAYTSSPTFTAPLTPITPAGSSLFAVYTTANGNPVTYCPTGSVSGKKILAGNDPANFQVNLACGVAPPAPLGFGGSGLTQAHFAASDAPLTVSEFSNFVTGQPVQLPSIAGAIGIVFRKAGVTALTLSEGQICGIFSGQIRTWDDAALAGAGIPGGITGKITLVYRGDGSGTSFSFLNHLSAVCPTNVAPGNTAAIAFSTTPTFSMGASSYVGLYTPSIIVNSNADMTSTVNDPTLDGLIGYAEAANAIDASTRMAAVKNSHSGVFVSPLTGFGPTALPVNLFYDLAISGTVNPTGRPVLTPLSTTSQCVAVVDPEDYADPLTGYPILAISYLLANTQGNGSDAAAVRNLLFAPYNKVIRPSVTRIGRFGSGYAWLSNATLDSTDPVAGIKARINGCVN